MQKNHNSSQQGLDLNHSDSSFFLLPIGCLPRLCSYSGGAAYLIVVVFTHLHGSGFNLEFETLFKSIGPRVAGLCYRQTK